MHYLVFIREQLGISQDYLSVLLGTSREQLNLAEMGRRNLPAKALRFAVQLNEHFGSVATPSPSDAKKHRMPKNLSAELDAMEDWFMKQGKYYKALAETITLKHEQANHCLTILPKIFTGLEQQTPENEKAYLVLKIIKDTSRQQLERYPLALAQRCATMGEELLALGGQNNPFIENQNIT